MRLLLIIIIYSFTSCKTNTTIYPPPVVEVEEAIKIEDNYEPLGNDFISGKVIHNDSSAIDLEAIKLTVNDSVCVNTYSNFEGVFSFYYNKSMINTNSFIEFVFQNYAIKKIPFTDFLKTKIVKLNQKGDSVTYDEHITFYETIRACKR